MRGVARVADVVTGPELDRLVRRSDAGPADEPVEIAPGDYVCYPGDAPHVFEALSPDTSAVIVMEHV